MSGASWPYPRLIAHRCGGSPAPENTLAGLRLAAHHGCRGVEFDVMLSAGGTPYLIHDEALERTTNGRGSVADTRDEVLDELDAGSRHSREFAGERIPRLTAAAELARALGLWCNIEIKPSAGTQTRTGHVVATLAAILWRDSDPPPLLSSFSVGALEAAREAAPDLPRGLLVEEVPADWRGRLQDLGCRSLHARADALGERRAREVTEAGYGLLCYTVNRPQDATRLFGWGVDALVTDRIDLLAA